MDYVIRIDFDSAQEKPIKDFVAALKLMLPYRFEHPNVSYKAGRPEAYRIRIDFNSSDSQSVEDFAEALGLLAPYHFDNVNINVVWLD